MFAWLRLSCQIRIDCYRTLKVKKNFLSMPTALYGWWNDSGVLFTPAFYSMSWIVVAASHFRYKMTFDWHVPTSVADPESSALSTPGSGMGFFWIPNPGYRIENPYFWELCGNFLGKKYFNSYWICSKFFPFTCSKINNFNFCDICGYKKR